MELAEFSNLLPENAQIFSKLIGLPLAVKLVEELGGTTFPVSKNQVRLGKIRYAFLAEVVGVEAADTLTQRFGGTQLYIPRCADALRAVRDRKIAMEFDALVREGQPSNTAVVHLARQYRLSDRRIWDILKNPPQDDTQSRLF